MFIALLIVFILFVLFIILYYAKIKKVKNVGKIKYCYNSLLSFILIMVNKISKSDFIAITNTLTNRIHLINKNYYDNITEEYFSRRIYVSNRATIYELLAKTDSFTIMTTNQKAYQHTDYYPDTRYFVMKGTTISSEVGWIKRKDYQPNALAMEFISILSSYYA